MNSRGASLARLSAPSSQQVPSHVSAISVPATSRLRPLAVAYLTTRRELLAVGSRDARIRGHGWRDRFSQERGPSHVLVRSQCSATEATQDSTRTSFVDAQARMEWAAGPTPLGRFKFPVRGTHALRASRPYKVLRPCDMGRYNSPLSDRINSDLPRGTSLDVVGDAMIHGPKMVARLVGSEWRTRCPHPKHTNG